MKPDLLKMLNDAIAAEEVAWDTLTELLQKVEDARLVYRATRIERQMLERATRLP